MDLYWFKVVALILILNLENRYRDICSKRGVVSSEIERQLGSFILKFVIYYCREILKSKGIILKDCSYIVHENLEIDLALSPSILLEKPDMKNLDFSSKIGKDFKEIKVNIRSLFVDKKL